MGRGETPAQLDLAEATTVRLRVEKVRVPRQREPQQERAIVWLPGEETDAAMRTCLDWCAERGYEVVGVVVDTGRPEQWGDIGRMLVDRGADVVVSARYEDLPTSRSPRSEIVALERAKERRRPRALWLSPDVWTAGALAQSVLGHLV